MDIFKSSQTNQECFIYKNIGLLKNLTKINVTNF